MKPSLTGAFKAGSAGVLGFASPQLQKLRGVHVFHQRHRDLVPRWDAVLKAMKADGRYQKLLALQS